LLKRYRVAADLSQEALAERAGLSPDAISTLERGIRRAPHVETVRALAGALGLSHSARQQLDRSVSRSRGPREAGRASQALVARRIPLAPTPLIDRIAELATARQLIRDESVRLLTVTGPGGVGKTRLTLELAHEIQGLIPDGVWFVDLDAVNDPDLVLAKVAEALGVAGREPSALLEALPAAIGDRRIVAVLDNFEHVLAAAPWIGRLLESCPGLKLVITSRVRLGLRWEHRLELRPLAVPDADAPKLLADLAAVPSVALFVERAQAADPAFSLGWGNADAVAALCRHLDGLPLALELAAAHANILTPAEILARVDGPLASLTWQTPDRPLRHQSLRAVVDGSYTRLRTEDQTLFRRVAVVPGVWNLEAAAAVTGLEGAAVDALERVGRLVDASLIQVRWDTGNRPGFRLLETMRAYAGEQLDASGDRAAAERAYAAFLLASAGEREQVRAGARA
jgi:predicted ATPase/DNA-binding XRE family transcriptional regulator